MLVEGRVPEQQPAGRVPAMKRVPRGSLIIAAAVLVLALVIGGIVALVTSGPSTMTLTARFATAPGLYPGNQVRILGMPVGEVTKVTPGPSYVTVVMQLPTTIELPADAQAFLMAPQIVNDRYVQLNPAYNGGPRLANNAMIPLTRTAVAISSRQVHSSGECGLCSPVDRFGVGRPNSVKREPSVPPRTIVSFGSKPARRMASSA